MVINVIQKRQSKSLMVFCFYQVYDKEGGVFHPMLWYEECKQSQMNNEGLLVLPNQIQIEEQIKLRLETFNPTDLEFFKTILFSAKFFALPDLTTRKNLLVDYLVIDGTKPEGYWIESCILRDCLEVYDLNGVRRLSFRVREILLLQDRNFSGNVAVYDWRELG